MKDRGFIFKALKEAFFIENSAKGGGKLVGRGKGEVNKR